MISQKKERKRLKTLLVWEHEGNNAGGDCVCCDAGKDLFKFPLHHYLTLAPNFSADVTTNTSPHRGNTRVGSFLQWSLKTFTVRSRYSGRVVWWDPGYLVDVLHQDVSVHQPSAQVSSLSDLLGDSTSMDVNHVDRRPTRRAKLQHLRHLRCPLTQTLSWCGGSSTCKTSLAWSGWSVSTWMWKTRCVTERDSSAVWGSYRVNCGVTSHY